jgi:hypothetical protein
MPERTNKVAVTIDVESDWGGRSGESRGIETGIPYILELLERLGINATFFISCPVVAANRNAICKIADAGHELASHGLEHENHSKLEREVLLEKIGKSKELIEKETGTKVVGFRSPRFRIARHLFEVLLDSGFRYDSSMVRNCEPFYIESGLLEVPVTSFFRIPFGLRYINSIGFGASKFLMKKLPSTVIFYLHPFDVISKSDYTKLSGHYQAKMWYYFRADRAAETLEKTLHWLKNDGKEFILIKEILK